MKIVVHASQCSIMPDFDFAAYDDNICPDGPVGYGRTPLLALGDLLGIVDGDPATEAAVEAEIAKLKEAA